MANSIMLHDIEKVEMDRDYLHDVDVFVLHVKVEDSNGNTTIISLFGSDGGNVGLKPLLETESYRKKMKA